uniref:Acyltransferase n=1 Tax=Spongospora subterranea TaxID=70186 RepID=A0A0H5R577_9EUKA|eukprot:CRZ09283.1 hypothetical protein [Spongospora subterranea]
MRSFIGIVHLGIFIFLWLIAASLPAWLILTLIIWGDFRLHIVVALYALIRHYLPRGTWDSFRRRHLELSQRHQYFRKEMTIIEEDRREPQSRHMLVFHPHGILCFGYIVNGNGSNELEKRGPYHWLGAWWMTNLPILSELVAWQRGGQVDKAHVEMLMQNGENIALIPGGCEEATLFRYNQHQVYLRKRRGFIVYALRHGYQVSPVYTFGEELTYSSWEGITDFRLWLNRYNIPCVVFWSKYWFLPYWDINLVTVVGKPIQFPHIPHPTANDIDKYFSIYVMELQALFERYVGTYAADPKSKLHIIL